jgi:hypothetical protein
MVVAPGELEDQATGKARGPRRDFSFWLAKRVTLSKL